MTIPQYPAEAVERLKATMTCLYPTTPDPDCSAAIALCDPADLAALLSYVEGMKWRPIESAPRDEDVLLVLPRYGASRFSIYEMAVGCMGTDGSWYSDSEETETYRLHEPKYWMPLPPAPDKEG